MMAFLTLSDDARAHLVLAIKAHRDRCRINGLAVPPELRQLEAGLSSGVVPGGQESSLFDTGLQPGQCGVDADVVTRQQAAVLMSVSVSSIDRLIRQGRLAVIRVGRSVRIRREDINEAVTSTETTKKTRRAA